MNKFFSCLNGYSTPLLSIMLSSGPIKISAPASLSLLIDTRPCEFSGINKAFSKIIFLLTWLLSLTKNATVPRPQISDSVLFAFCTLPEKLSSISINISLLFIMWLVAPESSTSPTPSSSTGHKKKPKYSSSFAKFCFSFLTLRLAWLSNFLFLHSVALCPNLLQL